MKVFLAIDLNNKFQQLLFEQIEPLRKDYPDFTWVPPKNYHITVQYIGEIMDAQKIKDLKPIIEELTYDIETFSLYSHKASILIDKRITLYVQFYKNNGLNKLVKRVQRSLGIRTSYRYLPHVTVAKYKIPSKQQYLLLKKKLGKLKVDIEIPVKNIFLYESVLLYPYPSYKELMRFPLADPIK